MKRTVYKGFGKSEKITVETTGYKDAWGAAVWAGEDGMTYDLQYARRSKTWAATPKMSLKEGIEKGLYK